MNEIIPRLWMGNAGAMATDADAVVDCQYLDQPRLANLNPNVPRPFLWLPFLDSTPNDTRNDLPPTGYLTTALAFIGCMRDTGRAVLVQCFSGKNRSGLVVGAYLIQRGMTPDAAITLIRSKRGEDALSNPTFVAALKGMA